MNHTDKPIHSIKSSIDPRRRQLLGAAAGAAALTVGSLLPIFNAEAQAQTMTTIADGADNFYRSDKASFEAVRFPTAYRTEVAGNLHMLNDLDRSARHPAIIVSHPMGAVKEQSANLYAAKLAEQGFVTLAIDMPFWGESSGEPRQVVSPELYAEAYSAAVDYLGTQGYVDRERIGVIGICGSGAFALSAAKIDPRLRAVATVSMYDHGTFYRRGMLGSVPTLAERQSILAEAAEQRFVEAEGGAVRYTSGAPLERTGNAIGDEFYDFYRTPRGEFTPEGASSQTTTMPTLATNVKFVNFYPLEDMELISPRPTLFVAGTEAHSREFSEFAFERAAEPKELHWVEGAGHVDLYDRVTLIPFDKLTEFFGQHLG
jgi:fermentation-respiration switch protein FrsA (DUF1100 family)